MDVLKNVFKENSIGKNVNLKKLANDTEGYTGADIEAIVREAGMNAMREDIKADSVENKHFQNAMKNITPSIDNKVIEYYQKLMESMKTTTAKDRKKDEVDYVG